MSIKRAFSKDTYTVARKINVEDPLYTQVDTEYKRGEGTIQPQNLTSNLTASGEVGLLVLTELFTKQAYPVVADAVQGYDSDLFLWEDIDGTARWYTASGWRDWAGNGKNSYQQVLGTYDESNLEQGLALREQDLSFYEIDEMVEATGSTKRVLALKMEDVKLPHNPLIPPPTPAIKERYVYTFDGLGDFLSYNSLDSTNAINVIAVGEGDRVSMTYEAGKVEGGVGFTDLKKADNQYLSTHPVTNRIGSNSPMELSINVIPTNAGEVNTILEFVSDITGFPILQLNTTIDDKVEIVLYEDNGFLFEDEVVIGTVAFRGIAPNKLLIGQLNTIRLQLVQQIPSFPTNLVNDVSITLNNVYSYVGTMPLSVMSGNSFNGTDYLCNNLGATLVGQDNTNNPRGDMNGVLQSFEWFRPAYSLTGVSFPQDNYLSYRIKETTGIVLNESFFPNNERAGTRVNTTDVDISISEGITSYLFSGASQNDFIAFDLFITEDRVLHSSIDSFIKKVTYDGVEIELNTFVTPLDFQFHTIEIELGSTRIGETLFEPNIRFLGTNSDKDLFYQGAVKDFVVTKGRKEFKWELKTKGSFKQDPVNTNALSFGFDIGSYSEDKWKLIVEEGT